MVCHKSLCKTYLCFAILIIIAEIFSVGCQAVNTNEEFPHLLRITEQSKKIHLISELVRNGHRLQVEEHLDLDSWNQLIQFRWHDEYIQAENGNLKSLIPNKITVMVINQDKQGRKILIQYEPYRCDQRIIYPEGVPLESGESLDDPNWRSLMEISLSQNADDKSISAKQRHMKTIETIISTSHKSPYLTKVNLEDTKNQAWVFGISATWLKAQFPFEDFNLNLRTHQDHGQDAIVSDIWHLDSDQTNLNITYYLNGLSLNNNIRGNAKTNADYELVQLIEIQEFHPINNDVIFFDHINVVAINLDFSGKLASDIFKIPLGFNCASNPMLQGQVNYFENLFDSDGFQSASKMLQLELIATKFKGLQDVRFYSSTDIKTFSFATSKHPVNPSKSLVMFHIHEDKYKTIRDYNNWISYTIHFKSIYCYINKLHQSSKSLPNHTLDPIEVYFSNGITLTMSVQILEYLFNSTRGDENEMRFINQISIASNKDELTFESRIPQSLEYLMNIIDSAGRSMEKSINIERVYEQSYVDSKEMYKIMRRGPLKLTRILLLVFNQERTQKLAQLQINVIKVQTPMSLTRRAHVFDISSCFKPEEKSMELEIIYPMNENLINYFGSRGHELIEEFYSIPFNWLTVKLNTNAKEYNEEQTLQKKQFDLSFNFLRVSKVEAKFSPNSELELRLRIIDRPSPIYSFEELESSTFLGDSEEEVLSTVSAEQCAQFCDYLNCRIFAFDRLIFECKLSFQTLDLNRKNDENELPSGNEIPSVKVAHRSSSKLHVRPKKNIDDLEEVSLAEIVSFIEHHENENDGRSLDLDYELNYESSDARIKREISIDKSPIMAFRYTDRSGGDYAPPVRRFLIPLNIKMSGIPISLDVGQEFQKVKVASAFKTTIMSMRYQIQIPKSESSHKKTPDEQTYVDKSRLAYYTIKRLNFVDIDACALLCYNIEDSNIRSGGEQTCSSFSYCSFERQCDLLIKTDFDYLKSAFSVIDIMPEVATNINSSDDLMKEGSDCNIKMRNYLSGYQGPISLPDNVFGYASTENIGFGLEYEWLRVFKSESSRKEESDPEKCARECLKLSKLGKMCLAFDYCVSNNPEPPGSNKEMFGDSCHLFLVLNYDKTDSSKIVREIGKTRYQLTRLKSKKDLSIMNGTVNTCKRYLTSHLSEFSHLKHKKISLQLKDKLELPGGDPMEDINLDTCALECSIRDFDCQAFEYCLSFDSKNNNVARKCSLFGGRKRGLKFDELTITNISLTEPSKECQIYLRNKIESLYDLVKLDSSKEFQRHGNDMSVITEHIGLIISFSILYITTTILIIIYVKSKTVREFAFRERVSNMLIYFRDKFSTS